MFLFGTNCESLIHKLGCLKPCTTRDLLDIATNHASGEEAVRAVFSGGQDKVKAKRADQDEGPSAQRGKKNKKDRHRSDNTTMVAAADRTGKQPQQGLPDHFNKLMGSLCTNHAYSIKHLYKDYELLKCFLRQVVSQRRETAKRWQPRKEARQARTEMVSPTLTNAS